MNTDEELKKLGFRPKLVRSGKSKKSSDFGLSIKTSHGAGGNVMWTMRERGKPPVKIYWNGPGGGLYLALSDRKGKTSLFRIEHPSANDQYNTENEARLAAVRFMKSPVVGFSDRHKM